ncbi:response regulator [Tuber magnatum]|uniref:Response regulator n=1 Tax=Tuber magnatum TaxID=42249 RepID=A0A317T1G8_9PEZI|nr:response regulator [Tuber magnatum]
MEGNSSGGGGTGGGSAASSSSDFVRKLYKMLEDPTHRHTVRWSDAGDSFIVVDTNEFTRNILPNHFKHSNFASFVRQLNKYDFHKIRNNEEGGGSSYGHQTWEFKHPDFQMNNVDNLDNIRRKAPAPRKQPQQNEDGGVQQIEELNSQVQELSKVNQEMTNQVQRLASDNHAVIQELNTMQHVLQQHDERVRIQEKVINNIMVYLQKLDDEMKEMRPIGGVASQHRHDNDGRPSAPVSPEDSVTGPAAGASASREHLSTPLQRAQMLLNNHPEILDANPSIGRFRGLSQSGPSETADYNDFGAVNRLAQNGQRPAALSNGIPTVPEDGSATFAISPGTTMVEPFSNGSLGYPMQPPHHENGGLGIRGRPAPSRKRSTPFVPPNWQTPPRVLLVEDDPTCARIGSKFLQTAECSVDMASNGLIAANKLNSGKYDLVLMDIVMPQLDGVSAASLVRQFDTTTPIIAMTSNIRRDDINMYFNHGMNDVLPKPFTKEGLLNMLEKYLSHLKANEGQIPTQLNFNEHDNRIIEDQGNIMVKGGLKYSQSPSKSPQGTVLYRRPPADAGEDPIGETPSAVEDTAYANIIPGYLGDSTAPRAPGAFSSPGTLSHGVRRGASEIDDSQQQLMGLDSKKTRY